MQPMLDKVKQEAKTLRAEVRERTLGFITAGLSLVVSRGTARLKLS